MWNPFVPRRIPVAKLGALGERRAAWFYRLRGFRIVERNLRTRAGELDLVVRRGGLLVIVEVKTRQSLRRGEGAESVHRRKQLQIIGLADAVLGRQRGVTDVRYDVLSLYWTGRRFVVTHHADAFRPRSDPRMPWRVTV